MDLNRRRYREPENDLLDAARIGDTQELQKCLELIENINYQKLDDNSALHMAVVYGNTENVKLLIDAGIDLNLLNRDGNTALHIAVQYKYTEIINLLIECGIDLNIKTRDGNTALHEAVGGYATDEAIVTLLLDRDCDSNIKNNDGKKASELAIYGTVRDLCKDHESHLPGLPIEVKKLDQRSAQVFSSLLGEESYFHFESRVMLAGEQGTGKTTIARHLVGKRPTRLRKSTDGIELYNGLSYIDRETKEWLGGQQDFSLEDITVCRSLLRQEKRNKNVQVEYPTLSSQNISDVTKYASLSASNEGLKHQSNESQSFSATLSTENFASWNAKNPSEPQFQTLPAYANSFAINMEKKLSGHVAGEKSERVDNDDTYDENKSMDDSRNASLKSGFAGDLHVEIVTKPGIITQLKRVFGITKQVKEVKVSITKEKFLEKSSKVAKKKLQKKKIAPIIIWDFGGQDVFYSTHQTFLTYRAIYIIVLDGSRKLDDPCPYEQYLPGKSGHKTARDYLLFWINTIVTYCKGSVQGFPKILVALTHKDQVNASEVEQRRHELFEEIFMVFHKTPLMQHLVIDDKIFVNAKDKYDPEMAKIKSAIIRESERQPTWGELLPKCFIPLELEFASLIRRNIHLIKLEHLKKINSLQPVRPLSEVELKVFLKFQHSIGKLLYFDEHGLDDRIILSPTLLIDAFKSIITDSRFCQGDKEREELWDVMSKKGVVSKLNIQTIWMKKKYQIFYKDKDYLLDVMAHLDILVQPKRYDSDRNRIPAEFYYVASMVRAKDDTEYLKSAGFTERSISIAFQSSSLMIPPALSFRFISYCLYVWAVKTYGDTNKEMLFHRSGVFTIDSSLDMYIACEDERIVVRLVHATSSTLIMRDVASSIYECLTSALEKISQLYIRTSSDQAQTNDASFVTRICCNSPNNACVLPDNHLAHTDQIWICPSHGIEHSIHTITSWIEEKEDEKCKPGCTVTKDEFLKATPSDIHLRRLSLLYSPFEAKELAIHLGYSNRAVNVILETEDPLTSSFAILLRCRDSRMVTFNDIKEAIESIGKESIHILCKLVKGENINFDMEPEKWDLVPTAEHIDRLAPLVGKYSLPFLIELGMDFNIWEQISHRQNERDLVRLNQDILEEWRFKFCRRHNLKPTLREIARAFSNIGKNVKIVDNTLSDLF